MSRKQQFRTVKGMRDILPPSSALWGRIEDTARALFRAYNYQEIRTPLVEPTALFARSVGTDTDIVTKEMYTWEDRDSASLTLRPEATASVVRAYIEHRLDQRPGVQKLFYMGPMFRRERPQKGRYRQFYQIGAEALGSESAAVDAEIIELLVELLARLGITGYSLWLNSVGCSECRPVYLAALRTALDKVSSQLCADCQRRAETNPLRVLDCKVPGDQPVIDALPTIAGSLCEPCGTHFGQVKSMLADRKIDYTLRPRLVRGLDYYTRTTFEFVHDSLGAQNSLLGGGRYDGLAEELGGLPEPGIGFSIGEDRLVLTLEQAANPSQELDGLDLYIAWMGDAAFRDAAGIARLLRGRGATVDLATGNTKLKRSLETASKLGAAHVLIIGDNELAEGRYPLRDMRAGEQETLSRDEILARFRKP